METTADKAPDGNGSQRLNDEKEPGEGPSAMATAPELPTDVRVKLRKLEKLETRYHGNLSLGTSYFSQLTKWQNF